MGSTATPPSTPVDSPSPFAPAPGVPSEPAQVWVAFDFDGTLTRRDSLLPFLHRVLGPARLGAALALESPWLAAYAAGVLDNEAAKVRVLRRVLGGMRRELLQDQGAGFAGQAIAGLLRADMVQRLRHHQELGHRCVLVTASLSVYTEPWGRSMGFEHVLSSELVFDAEGRATGELLGGNCWGPEKVRRLQTLLGGDRLAYAYGDSRGDREMLALAEKGVRLQASNRFGADLPAL